jgi:hypothetical protein
MQAPRWVLIWHSQGKTKIGCRCRPTRRFGFDLAYARLASNGLLRIRGTSKKSKLKTAPKPKYLKNGGLARVVEWRAAKTKVKMAPGP